MRRETSNRLQTNHENGPVVTHEAERVIFILRYYKNYCYLPLLALLRPSNIDGCAETEEHLVGIVPRLRKAWPDVRIIVRSDSGFCREPIMKWCEEHKVDYVFGLAKNKRLHKIIGKAEHLSKGSNPRFVVTCLSSERIAARPLSE